MRTVKLLFTMSFQASVSTPVKSGSMWYTGSERRPKIDADQLLPNLFVERTGTAFGLKEVRLSNPLPIPTPITEDYARAIQEERKKLIKAIAKARDEHGLKKVKVEGRFLYIDKDRYDHENIPGFLK